MTAQRKRGPWHMCDGTGATTRAGWPSREALVAHLTGPSLYPDGIPSWLGQPCDRPLIRGGYRHAEPVR